MPERLQFEIDIEDADERLDVFIARRCDYLSRMYLSRLISQGVCLVNGQVAPGGQHLKAGDRVEIELEKDAATAMRPEDIPLDVLYEDERLLVLIKPAGMLVHPTRGVKTGTLLNALAYHLNKARSVDDASQMTRPGLVHRLDRATSGLMVIAKDQRALSILARHFHERQVEKRYAALLRGHISTDELVIEARIGRDEEAWPKWQAREDGKAARTHLRVTERRSDQTLVELNPLTGRTNQLRIHCAHVGHPIVGDKWYGGADFADEPRLCLHATELAFHHPDGGRWMEFCAPMSFSS